MDEFAKRIEALSAEKKELLEIFLKERKIDTDWLQEAYIAPRDPVERALADIWAQVLGVERVGIQDNFFELGGDSILSIQIIAKAGERGLQIPRNQLFEHPTIAELAPLVGSLAVQPAAEEEPLGPVPLAPAQRGLLDEPEPEHQAHSVALEVREADAGRLELAVGRLLERHDALRLGFERAGEEWRQLAGEPAAGFFTRQDLSHLAAAEQVEAARQAADRLRGGWDLAAAPLLRLRLLNRGAGQPAWILFAVHRLVADAESFRILLQELQTIYDHGVARLVSGSTPFRGWCRRLARYASSPELAHEVDWWSAQAEPPVPGLPVDPPDRDGREALAPVEVALSAEETQALLEEIPAVHRTQVTDVLLTALAQAVAAWTGGSEVRFDLEGSARSAAVLGADLSRTVGACSFVYPVQLSLAGAAGPAAALRAVKQQLRRVPERGLGFSLLSAGAGPAGAAERIRALPSALILIAYRPRLEAAAGEASPWRLVDESLGLAEEERHAHALVVTAAVAGGRARIRFQHREDLFRRATIEGVAARCGEALRALIAQCSSGETALTPSDFPDAELSEGDLDRLFVR